MLGQGARVGLFQSIMPKPPNVRYVFPMFSKAESDLPESLLSKDLLVIFNIESQRPDDLLYNPAHFDKAIKIITDSLQRIESLGFIVFLPVSLQKDTTLL